MIPAGRLNQQVTLQSNTALLSAEGESTVTWSDIDVVWASVTGLSQKERILRDSNQTLQTNRVTIRYRDDVMPGWRVLDGDNTYNILSVTATTDKSALILDVQRIQ